MTPKEKARELVDKIIDKMFDLRDGYNSIEVFDTAKQCALIAVDEIIDLLSDDINPLVNYWFEVKQEIEKL